MPDVPDPDGVPYPQACDALKLAGLEGHAAAHIRIPDLEARLASFVAMAEDLLALRLRAHGLDGFDDNDRLKMIARHRGEASWQTWERLMGHPPRATVVPDESMWEQFRRDLTDDERDPAELGPLDGPLPAP